MHTESADANPDELWADVSWPTTGDFSLPRGGDFPAGDNQADWNPDVGLDYEYSVDDLMPPDEMMEKANLHLDRYGFEPISQSDLLKETYMVESEVGDDEICVSNNKAYIAIKIVITELLGLKVSWSDTSISRRFGNFTEDLIILPDGYGQTYRNVRQTGFKEDMSYYDLPKLRLAIDIRPMRMNHSSTNDGKASMVGRRQAWIPRKSNIKPVYELFSLFQDVNLGIHRDEKFAYLPEALGGYGKKLAFGHPENLERFMAAFKNGLHTPLLRDIIRRSTNFMRQIQDGHYPEKDPLLSHVVRFQSSFHDWIKMHSVYAPIVWMDCPDFLVPYKAGTVGVNRLHDQVISRLLGEGELVTESQIVMHYEHSQICENLLSQKTVSEFNRERLNRVQEWRSLSMFSLESYGMIREIHVNFDQMGLRNDEVRNWVLLVANSQNNLKTMFRREDVYWRDAIDIVYKRGPMMVPFSCQPRVAEYARTLAYNQRYHKDVVDTEESEDLQALVQWWRTKEGDVPRHLVNDDDFIIAKIDGPTAIVTDDIMLCRRANLLTHQPVLRVPLEWYIKTLYFGAEMAIEPYLHTLYPHPWKMEVDEGSFKSFEEKYFHDGVLLKEVARQPFDCQKGLRQRDHKTVIEDEDYFYEPNTRRLLFDRFHVTGQLRRYAPTFGGAMQTR